jgi:hypothetical protein
MDTMQRTLEEGRNDMRVLRESVHDHDRRLILMEHPRT